MAVPNDVTSPLRSCLFDLDGVITRTAVLHEVAWKEMFDTFLAGHGQPPFTHEDYERHVDGLPRLDGVRALLAARGLHLPEGGDGDPPEAETVHGLGRRKNELVLARIAAGGVEVYPGSVRFLHAVREAGLRTAVVSSSANAADVVAAVGLAALFDARVDGVTAAERHLPGKPAPDAFLAGAAALDTEPAQAAVFEDALAGVEAGRAGGFGLVVGVDRSEGDDPHGRELAAHGADVVVRDLADLPLTALTSRRPVGAPGGRGR